MSNVNPVLQGSSSTTGQSITLTSTAPITVLTDSSGAVTGVTTATPTAGTAQAQATADVLASSGTTLGTVVAGDAASLATSISTHAIVSSYLTKGLLAAGFVWTNIGSQFSPGLQKWVDVALIAAYTVEQYVFGTKA